jgi:hypothetical protein
MRQRPGMTVAAMAMLLPFGAGAADSAAAKPKPATVAPKAIAPDFLEYLATLEGEDDNWTDFERVVEQPPAKPPKAAAPKAAKADESR